MKDTNAIVIKKLNSKHEDWKAIEFVVGLILILGIVLVDLIFHREFIVQGKMFFNSLSEMLGAIYGRRFPIYTIDISEQGEIPVFIITLVILGGILFYLTVKTQNICVNILFIVCAILFYGLFGNKEQIIFLLLFVIVNIIAIRQSCLRDFVCADDVPKAKVTVKMVLAALGIVIVCAGFGDKSIKVTEDANHMVKQVAEKVRYSQEGDTALIVTMSNPQSYYLRGFVGEHIGEYGWEEMPASERYESLELFYWLHKDGFYGQSQLAEAAVIFNEKIQSEVPNQVHIKNVGASLKYVYVPYEYAEDNERLLQEKVIGDENIKSEGWRGNQEYTFMAVSNQVSRYPEILKNIEQIHDEKAQSYIKNEGFYNEHVYKSYRDLSEENVRILDTYLGSYDRERGTHASYTEAKEKILNLLSEKIHYVSVTEHKPSGEEYLKNFLEINCEGNDADYASAATLMFRYYGIPARYVEGYLITPEDVEHAETGKPFNIPKSNIHCWSEYYQDGVGWIPFETAPPYIDLMEKADEISGAGMSGSEKTEQNIEEIEPDNYEEKEPQKNQNKNEWNLLPLIIGFIGIVFLFLIAAYVLRYIRVKKNRKRMLEISDNNMAIQYMFLCMMDIMFEFKITKKNQLLKKYKNDMAFAEKEGMEYSRALRIYEKACYSGDVSTDDERKYISEYTENTRKNVYESLNLIRKIKWKVILMLG